MSILDVKGANLRGIPATAIMYTMYCEEHKDTLMRQEYDVRRNNINSTACSLRLKLDGR